MNTNISQMLKEIKGASCLSETALAALLGTSQPTISRILNGQQSCKIATYEAIKAKYAYYQANTNHTDQI